MRNYKWMLKTLAGSKRLKGMRDLINSMWRTSSYSARLDEPAAGKVLVTAFWGCLGDQGSGTNNYKGPRRGKGTEAWPSAFSKYCFKKKTKFGATLRPVTRGAETSGCW